MPTDSCETCYFHDRCGKKLEKLKWQLNNPDLTKNQRKKKEDEVADIEKQLKALESQLTPLHVTRIVHTTHD